VGNVVPRVHNRGALSSSHRFWRELLLARPAHRSSVPLAVPPPATSHDRHDDDSNNHHHLHHHEHRPDNDDDRNASDHNRHHHDDIPYHHDPDDDHEHDHDSNDNDLRQPLLTDALHPGPLGGHPRLLGWPHP
jgi:hypothetical protein